MKKILWILLMVAILASGYLTYAQLSGGAVYTFGLPLGGERAKIRNITKRFFEYIKFRDLQGLASLVALNAHKSDIDTYLSKTFGMPVNDFDLHKTTVAKVELDSSGQRARVQITLHGENLIKHNNITISKVIFLYHDDKRGWLFDITASEF